jgi:hypothetical protein
MNSRHFVRKKRLVEWETIMHIVRKEVEPLEYRGSVFNLTQHDLQNPEKYNAFTTILLDVARK